MRAPWCVIGPGIGRARLYSCVEMLYTINSLAATCCGGSLLRSARGPYSRFILLRAPMCHPKNNHFACGPMRRRIKNRRRFLCVQHIIHRFFHVYKGLRGAWVVTGGTRDAPTGRRGVGAAGALGAHRFAVVLRLPWHAFLCNSVHHTVLGESSALLAAIFSLEAVGTPTVSHR